MAVFRFLASLFLLIAVIALISDATPALNGTAGFVPTAIGRHIGDISPSTLEGAKTGITDSVVPWLWDAVVAPLLATPTFVLFGVLALATGYLGRRRHKINIYVN
ncbi:MAG: hypothetical protein ACT4N2_12270 [Hyphomicrobium sp.]